MKLLTISFVFATLVVISSQVPFDIFQFIATDKPADEPTDKPADEPTDKPADEPTDKPADEPIDKPSDNLDDDDSTKADDDDHDNNNDDNDNDDNDNDDDDNEDAQGNKYKSIHQLKCKLLEKSIDDNYGSVKKIMGYGGTIREWVQRAVGFHWKALAFRKRRVSSKRTDFLVKAKAVGQKGKYGIFKFSRFHRQTLVGLKAISRVVLVAMRIKLVNKNTCLVPFALH